MQQYRVVSNSHLDMLEKEVNDLLAQGWKSLGGISMAYKHEHAPNLVSHLVYAQAMTMDGE